VIPFMYAMVDSDVYTITDGIEVIYSDEMTKPKGPELPFECHNDKPVSADAAWKAVVAMCGGGA
jgi:hypothetical protein